MDKSKLIRIIEKELEELKVLTEEVVANEKDTSLIIEIALGKARVLCQEMELLRDLSAKGKVLPGIDSLDEEGEESFDEDEVSDLSDPELEIISPDDETTGEESNEDESLEEEEIEEEEEEEIVYEDDEEDEEIGEDQGTDDLIEFGENSGDEEILPEEPEVEEQKASQPSGIREIELDEDEDIETVKAAPVSTVADRPVMHEIPKPEISFEEKKDSAESFQKEPSLNDAIGEKKTPETTIASGPISSLRAAIGLNDRFLFIREIFGNNTDKYNTIIDQLDKLETQQQAVELLKANLTLQKNETSMKFVDLLKRRFSK